MVFLISTIAFSTLRYATYERLTVFILIVLLLRLRGRITKIKLLLHHSVGNAYILYKTQIDIH